MPRTYERIGKPLPLEGGVESLAYSPDGQTIAVGGTGYIRLIDARTRGDWPPRAWVAAVRRAMQVR